MKELTATPQAIELLRAQMHASGLVDPIPTVCWSEEGGVLAAGGTCWEPLQPGFMVGLFAWKPEMAVFTRQVSGMPIYVEPRDWGRLNGHTLMVRQGSVVVAPNNSLKGTP